MKGPTTYSEWVLLLNRFSDGDDSVFTEMNAGKFTLDAGTAERFIVRIEEAYRIRKLSWINSFKRLFEIQNIKKEEEFGITLQEARRKLLPLVQFTTVKGLPEEITTILQKDLSDFFLEIRKSLKEGISKSEKPLEGLLFQLNAFEFPELKHEQPQQNIENNNNKSNIIPSSGRKIIF